MYTVCSDQIVIEVCTLCQTAALSFWIFGGAWCFSGFTPARSRGSYRDQCVCSVAAGMLKFVIQLLLGPSNLLFWSVEIDINIYRLVVETVYHICVVLISGIYLRSLLGYPDFLSAIQVARIVWNAINQVTSSKLSHCKDRGRAVYENSMEYGKSVHLYYTFLNLRAEFRICSHTVVQRMGCTNLTRRRNDMHVATLLPQELQVVVQTLAQWRVTCRWAMAPFPFSQVGPRLPVRGWVWTILWFLRCLTRASSMVSQDFPTLCHSVARGRIALCCVFCASMNHKNLGICSILI